MDSSAISYMTIPYVENGKGRTGVDCYGLCQLWYADQLGVVLGDYGYDRSVPHRHHFRCGKSPFLDCVDRDFVAVDTPERHDIVLLRNQSKTANHVGIVLSETHFLHALENIGVVASRLSDWADRTVGIYRHRSR